MNNFLTVRRLYYQSVKQMIKEPKCRVRESSTWLIRYDILYALILLHYLITCVQILWLSLRNSDKDSELAEIKWNPLVTVLGQSSYYYDPMLMASHVIMYMLDLYYVYLFYHRPYFKLTIGQVLHQLVVLDFDSYCEASHQENVNKWTTCNLILVQKENLKNWYRPNTNNRINRLLTTAKLDYQASLRANLPGVSISLRLKMIAYQVWLERFTTFLLLFNCKW